MSLPVTRNRSYGPGSPVRSADLNDLQDSIIGGKHGEIALALPASFGLLNPSAGAGAWAFTTDLSFNPLWGGSPTGTQYVTFPLPLFIGDRIKEVRALVRDTAGGAYVTLSLAGWRAVGTDITVTGSPVNSAGDGTYQTIAITGLLHVVARGDYYRIVVAANGGTTTDHRIFGVEVTYDHP